VRRGRGSGEAEESSQNVVCERPVVEFLQAANDACEKEREHAFATPQSGAVLLAGGRRRRRNDGGEELHSGVEEVGRKERVKAVAADEGSQAAEDGELVLRTELRLREEEEEGGEEGTSERSREKEGGRERGNGSGGVLRIWAAGISRAGCWGDGGWGARGLLGSSGRQRRG
jgi:hypothetical protein